MQVVSDKTLVERAPSVQRISGRGTCCNCESEIFQVVIYNDGTHDIACADPQCRTVWTALGKGQGEVSFISKTVDDRGNEPSHLVQAAEEAVIREELRSGYNQFMREYMRKWRARKGK